MKKILLSLLLFISITAFSQDYRVVNHCGFSSEVSAIDNALFTNIIGPDECLEQFSTEHQPNGTWCYTMIIACTYLTKNNWIKVEESQNIKLPQQVNEGLSLLKSDGLCTYETSEQSSPALAESSANSFIGSKTDILVFSSDLVEDWVADGGHGYYIYYYKVTYLRTFGSCY